ncbi:MAG: hypothetical protein NBV67_12265 [Tagaea sp.]|nr:hypothetical protein [Tagaea sp.]
MLTLGLAAAIAAAGFSTRLLAQTLAVTECPRLSPADERTRLVALSILHDGDVEFGYPTPDVEERRGRRVYRMNDFEVSEFRNASLECFYATTMTGPRTSHRIRIPGLLLRCESEELPPRSIRSPPDPGDRFWCTSRIEVRAR